MPPPFPQTTHRGSGLPSCPFSPGVPTKTLHVPRISGYVLHAPAHLIPLVLMAWICNSGGSNCQICCPYEAVAVYRYFGR